MAKRVVTIHLGGGVSKVVAEGLAGGEAMLCTAVLDALFKGEYSKTLEAILVEYRDGKMEQLLQQMERDDEEEESAA